MLHLHMHLSAHLQETLSSGSNFGGPQMSLSAAIPCAFLATVKQTRDIPKQKSSLDSKNAETFPRTQLAPLCSLKSSTMLWNPSKLVRNTSTSGGGGGDGGDGGDWQLWCRLESQHHRPESHRWGRFVVVSYVAGELQSCLPELQRLKDTIHVDGDGGAQEGVWTNAILINSQI